MKKSKDRVVPKDLTKLDPRFVKLDPDDNNPDYSQKKTSKDKT